MDYEYDVKSFDKEISLAEKGDSPEKRAASYKAAVHNYRGKFLTDVDEEWVVIERERLHQNYMDALLKLAEYALTSKEYNQTMEYCEMALKEDSCNEEAHRIAMRMHAVQGNRALVVRQYEQCCQALDEELGANPSNQTRILYNSLIK